MLFARSSSTRLRTAASTAAVAVLATAVSALMPVTPAAAAVVRPLTLGYDQDVYGDFLLAGNGAMRCPVAGDSPSTSATVNGTQLTLADCATAANRGGTTVNDNYDMQWADVDGVAGTFNSSRAAVTIPAGARVDFARLSWAGNTGRISAPNAGVTGCGARQAAVGVNADLPPGAPSTAPVSFTVGGGAAVAYAPGTSYVTDPGSGANSSAEYYSAFRDVTGQFAGVATGSPVQLTLANVWTPEGFNCFGGWSLVLVYAFADATTAAPLKRSVQIFNGHVRQLPGEQPTSTTVSGLRTATSDARVGITAYEGDFGITGDALAINGTAVPERATGGVLNNYFTSTAEGAAGPTAANNFSVDAKSFTTAAIPSARTSAQVTLSTTGDSYLAQQLVVSAPVPDIRAQKVPGTTVVRAGGSISFTITVSNPTPSALNGVSVVDPQFPACNRSIGNLPGNGAVSYTCTTTAPTDDFQNTATTSGTDFTNETVTDTVTTPPIDVVNPAISLVKTADKALYASGETVTFTTLVRNTGDATLTDVRVADATTPSCVRTVPSLAPGASSSATCTTTAPVAGASNTATVTATDPTGAPVTATSTAPAPTAGSISGRVFSDAAGDGAVSPADSGIAGVTVTLTGTTAANDPISRTTTTGADGSYSFTGVPAGSYTVVETQPAGFTDGVDTPGTNATRTPATNDSFTVTLPDAGTSTGSLFAEVPAGSIAGSVYEDVDGSGARGGTEPGIANVTVTLTGSDDGGNSVSRTTTTTSTGAYAFPGLRAGTYVVTETQPGGFVDGRETVGSSGGALTPPDSITGITLTAGDAATGYAFGEVRTSTLTGTVVVDGAPVPVPVTLTLTGTDDLGATVSRTIQTARGTYVFTGLRPGTYAVTETQPAGYGAGSATPGTSGGSVSGANAVTGIRLLSGTDATGYRFDDTTGRLSGTVFTDSDRDGDLDAGEPGREAGLTVTATGPGGTRTTQTTAGGAYAFPGLLAGSYTVTFTAPADSSLTSPGTLTTTLPAGGSVPDLDFGLRPERPPVAVDDSASTPFQTAVTIPVLANDSDPDGDPISVLSRTDPANGTVTCTATACTYTPRAGFSGTDTFTYVVTDGRTGGTDVATVTVLVDQAPNAPPVYTDAATNDAQTVPVGAPVTAVTATDPENGPLTYTTGDPLPPGVVLNADGTFTGSPTTPGTYVVRIVVTDDGTLTDTTTLTITVPPLASVSGRVFADGLADGAPTAGDSGISGVTVTLTGTSDVGQAVSRTTTTVTDGTFTFTGVPAGTYVLAETQPAGFADGQDTAGTGATVIANDRVRVVLASGDTSTGTLFAELPQGSIAGSVYDDANADGVRGADETTGIGGVTVTLSGNDETGTPVSRTTTTNAGTGRYSFLGLRAGTYAVTETQPTGFLDGREAVGTSGGTLLAPDTIRGIALTTGTAADGYTFGEVRAAALAGSVNLDRGGPLAGVTVTLTGTDDLGATVSRTTQTSSDGAYTFAGLRPGTYAVTETQPGAYGTGTATVGTAGGGIADANSITGIVLGSGVQGIGYLFTDTTASLSGTVFTDTDRDGVRDGGEPGRPGPLTVTASGPGAVRTTQTGADGTYSFVGLPAGSFTVSTTAPAGTSLTTPGSRTVAVPAGGSVPLVDFGLRSEGPPVAVDDRASTAFETPVTIAVLGNDTDPDGDPLTVVSTSGATGGTVTCDGTTCRFTPATGFTGEGRFDYVISDGRGGTSTATALVTVGARPNRAPAFTDAGTNDAQTVTVPSGTLTRVTAVDPDGTTPTYALVPGSGSLPPGITLNADGTFTGSPTTPGTYVVQITATDGDLSDTTTLTVLVPEFGTVSGRVFNDLNDDGAVQQGATGIGGVTLTLTPAGGGTALTRVTDADGQFSFGPLGPGTYVLTQTQPAGYTDGKDSAGTQAALTGNDEITVVLGTLPSQDTESSAGNLFGEVAAGSLSGAVYDDLDGDGARSVDEPGLAGVTVRVTGSDDAGNPVDRTVTTGTDGSWTVVALRAGTYAVTETQPTGLLDGAETAGSAGGTVGDDTVTGIELAPGEQATGYLFGEVRPATVSGRVLLDAGAPAAPVEVRLTGPGTDVTTTTATDGTFSFAGLRPGTYVVTETQPAAFGAGAATAGTPSAGSPAGTTGGTAQQPNTVGGIVLRSGAVVGDVRFTDTTGSLTGTVFGDADRDGVLDAGEPGRAGVDVLVQGPTGPVTRTTGPDGTYALTGLPAGTYTVSAVAPAGTSLTGPGSRTVVLPAGGTGTADFGLRPETAPIAEDDAVTTPFQTAIAIPVLTTGTPDRDPDGDPIEVVANTGSPDGQVSCTATTCTFTPNPGFSGPASFEYTISDGRGGFDTAVVTVTVQPEVNTPPSFTDAATNDRQVVTVGGTPAPLQAVDAQPGPLVYTATGTLPPGVVLRGDGVFTGSPTTPGTYDVTITVTDGGGLSETQAFTVVVPALAEVRGRVVSDDDRSGADSAGDSGISGVQITLTGTSVAGVTVTRTTLTTADGRYLFDELPAGTYTMTETQPAGFVDGPETAGTGATVVGDDAVRVVLEPGASSTGTRFLEIPTASVSGSVYVDVNSNGVRDGAETTGIGGVVIRLSGQDEDGGAVDRTTTSAPLTGAWSFSGLRGGTYTVSQTQPAGFLDGLETVGTAGGVRLEPDTIAGLALAGGQSATGYAFGEVLAASLAGRVLVDGAPSAVPVTVLLTGTDDRGNAVERTAVTSGGTYVFQDLRPGTYDVTEQQPAGLGAGTATVGTAGGTVASPNSITGIVLEADRDASGYVFTDTTGTIGGTVFDDTDRDGVQDAGEPGRGAGLTVTLDGPTGTTTTTTGADGSYAFTGLVSGDYVVRYATGAGTSLTTPASRPVALPAGGTADRDFGVRPDTAPDAVDDLASTTFQTPVTVDVLGNDRDADGDALTVTVRTQPTNGTVTCTTAGSCTYVPAAGTSGPDAFTYTLTDATGRTDTATVRITVAGPVDEAPAFTSAPSNTAQTVEVGAPVTAVEAVDPEGQPLRYAVTGGALPPGVQLDPATGALTGTPTVAGTYPVTIAATDPGGLSATTDLVITVPAPPVRQEPVFTAATTNDAQTVRVGGTPVPVVAEDPDGDDALLRYTLTDGALPPAVTLAEDGSFTGTATVPGTYTATITVTDAQGLSTTTTLVVTVPAPPAPQEPVFTADATNDAQTVPVGGTPVPVVAEDPDGDDALLRYTLTDGALPPAVTLAEDGSFTGTATVPGTYTATITVTDAQGLSTTTTLVVTVPAPPAPQAPVFTADATNEAQTVPLGGTVAPVRATDPDGDDADLVHVVTGGSLPPGVTLTDGGTFTGAPTVPGRYTVEITVTDPQTLSDVTTLVITVPAPPNRAPVANPDEVTTPQGQPVDVVVTANDTDADLDPLTAVLLTQPANGAVTCTAGTCTYTPDAVFVGTDTFTYAARDTAGATSPATTVTVTVVAPAPANQPPAYTDAPTNSAQTVQPGATPQRVVAADPDDLATDLQHAVSSGQLPPGITLQPDGTFSGTVSPTAAGQDYEVFLVVRDPDGATSQVDRLVITVPAPVNGAPTARDDRDTTPYQTAVVIPVGANDSDPDGDRLVITSVTQQPAQGTVTCTTGATTGANTCTYTPDPTATGTDTFSYQVADGRGGTDEATVTVVIGAPPAANTAPVAQDDAASTPYQTQVVIAVGANDSDPDGDTLSLAGVTQPTDGRGTVSCAPDGSSCTFTPSPTATGTSTFTYTVTDGRGATSTATVTVVIGAAPATNRPPVAVADSASTPYQTAVVIPVLGNDTDPDSDPLTLVSVTQPTDGKGRVECTVQPDGSTACTFFPTATATGTSTFTYVVGDGRGATDTGTVTVTIGAAPPANTPPTAGDDTASTAFQTPVTVPVGANDRDADGDVLSLVGVTNGTKGTVSCTADGSSCTYTPAAGATGTDTFTYTVTDGRGATATATVTVTIGSAPVANQAPAFTAAPTNTAQTVPVGATATAVLATDADDTVLVYTATGEVPGLTLLPDGTFRGTATTPGTYTLTVTVTDPDGLQDVTTLVVTVPAPANRAPVAVDDRRSTPAGTPVTVAVLGNDSDPDGDPLTITSSTQPATGGTVVCTGTACTFTPAAGFTGTTTFTYTVGDGRGGASTATVTVEVLTATANRAPVFAPAPATQTVQVGSPLGPIVATDPEGGAVTITVTGGTLPPGITVNPDGTTTGTATTPGTFPVQLTATDALGATAVTTITVVVPAPVAANRPPVAVDDSARTPEGTAVTVVVLTNDTDADGDPLTVTGSTPPRGGTVDCTPTACVYTPDPGFSGTDTFTYTVSDGQGGTDTATVTVVVVADPVLPVVPPTTPPLTPIGNGDGGGGTGTGGGSGGGAGGGGAMPRTGTEAGQLVRLSSALLGLGLLLLLVGRRRRVTA